MIMTIEGHGLLYQFWQGIAAAASVIALWAHTKASQAAVDPVDELVIRLRHPIRWTMRHPVIALKRKRNRRSGVDSAP